MQQYITQDRLVDQPETLTLKGGPAAQLEARPVTSAHMAVTMETEGL